VPHGLILDHILHFNIPKAIHLNYYFWKNLLSWAGGMSGGGRLGDGRRAGAWDRQTAWNGRDGPDCPSKEPTNARLWFSRKPTMSPWKDLPNTAAKRTAHVFWILTKTLPTFFKIYVCIPITGCASLGQGKVNVPSSFPGSQLTCLTGVCVLLIKNPPWYQGEQIFFLDDFLFFIRCGLWSSPGFQLKWACVLDIRYAVTQGIV